MAVRAVWRPGWVCWLGMASELCRPDRAEGVGCVGWHYPRPGERGRIDRLFWRILCGIGRRQLRLSLRLLVIPALTIPVPQGCQPREVGGRTGQHRLERRRVLDRSRSLSLTCLPARRDIAGGSI